MADRSRRKEKQRLKRKEKQRLARRVGAISPYKRLGEGEVVAVAMAEEWRERGMTPVYILRRAPGGLTGMACFLIDTWCAGLKDAFGTLDMTLKDFDLNIERYSGQCKLTMKRVSLQEASGMVLAGIRFATQNGFRLPAHYDRWLAFLGDHLNWREADISEFGRDGKLCWIGPIHDLQKRLICGNAEEFLRRPDVTFITETSSPMGEFADEAEEFDDAGEFEDEPDQPEDNEQQFEDERRLEHTIAGADALAANAAHAPRGLAPLTEQQQAEMLQEMRRIAQRAAVRIADGMIRSLSAEGGMAAIPRDRLEIAAECFVLMLLLGLGKQASILSKAPQLMASLSGEDQFALRRAAMAKQVGELDPAVKDVLGPVVQYMAGHPDEYKAHVAEIHADVGTLLRNRNVRNVPEGVPEVPV